MLLPTSSRTTATTSASPDVDITWTQIIGLAFGVLVTFSSRPFLRFTKLGTAMRALADDREITSTLGVPVRRVEAVAWLGSGLIAGAAGLLLSDLVGLDAVNLTFLVISSLAAALIAQLRSLVGTLLGGPRRRSLHGAPDADHAVAQRDELPVHALELPGRGAVRAGDRRPALPRAPPRRLGLADGR